ncbi:MAG: hypothetical protein AB7H80_15505 [Candidatus Kapaibacterium sp.]
MLNRYAPLNWPDASDDLSMTDFAGSTLLFSVTLNGAKRSEESRGICLLNRYAPPNRPEVSDDFSMTDFAGSIFLLFT